jgi:aminoglycoside phosphotransferase (APT) family kinase protein
VVSDTAHQVVREARIIAALASSGVPVPKILAVGEDPEIIGAPFLVMSYIGGEIIRLTGLPRGYVEHPGEQKAVGEQLVDTLSDLHDFDWRTSSLAGPSLPENFLERQVDRWLGRLA